MTKVFTAGLTAFSLFAASAAFAQPAAAPVPAPAAAPAAQQANCMPKPATPAPAAAPAAGAPAAAPAPAPAAPAGTAATNASACAKTKYDNNTSLKVLMADEKAKAVLNANIGPVVSFLEAALDMLPDEFSVQVLHDMFGDMSGVDDAMLKKIGDELGKIS